MIAPTGFWSDATHEPVVIPDCPRDSDARVPVHVDPRIKPRRVTVDPDYGVFVLWTFPRPPRRIGEPRRRVNEIWKPY